MFEEHSFMETGSFLAWSRWLSGADKAGPQIYPTGPSAAAA